MMKILKGIHESKELALALLKEKDPHQEYFE
jgi:hypothetical protein